MSAGLNAAAWEIAQRVIEDADAIEVRVHTLANGTTVIDFGVEAAGSLRGGIELARICTSGLAEIGWSAGDAHVWPGIWVEVRTDHPVQACMLSQYAGWPVKLNDGFFAMGSGPMRLRRGKEKLLLELGVRDDGDRAVGVLETQRLPDELVSNHIADQCGVAPERLVLAVAPTHSMAGCVQIVARSLETCLHQLHELGGDLQAVRSGWGIAPLCPPSPDFAKSIGRTNDAILYGARVSLWVDGDDEAWQAIVGQLPSSASRDYGRPFAEVFKAYDYDFYRIDPRLFSPAEVLVINQRSGAAWRAGRQRPDLIRHSFELVDFERRIDGPRVERAQQGG